MGAGIKIIGGDNALINDYTFVVPVILGFGLMIYGFAFHSWIGGYGINLLFVIWMLWVLYYNIGK